MKETTEEIKPAKGKKMRKRRKRTGNIWPGTDKERKFWSEEEKGSGRTAMVPLPRNPTQPPLFSSLHPPFILPSTQLPPASYHGNRRGAENEGRDREKERQREKCVV